MKGWLRRRRQRQEMILVALLAVHEETSDNPRDGMYTLNLWRISGMGPGTMWSTLERLKTRGMVNDWFADGPYPRRRMCRLTPQWRDLVTVEHID